MISTPKEEAADVLADLTAASTSTESADAVSVLLDPTIARSGVRVNPQPDPPDPPYNEQIVQCLLILARRGRQVLEAEAAAARAAAEGGAG